MPLQGDTQRGLVQSWHPGTGVNLKIPVIIPRRSLAFSDINAPPLWNLALLPLNSQ